MEYFRVQEIAKETMSYIKSVIVPGMKLSDIKEICESKLIDLGADSFWYWDVGALCFAGEETTVSVSGRDYKVSDRIVGRDDIITIDLSPQCGNIWGDYARTIVVQDGYVVEETERIRDLSWREGILTEEKLHIEMETYVTERTTFEELYYHINSLITEMGFINCDFLGNLGHSIEERKSARIYIEKGNKSRLSDVRFFTFEPHIRKLYGRYGYKREDIYYFRDNALYKL